MLLDSISFNLFYFKVCTRETRKNRPYTCVVSSKCRLLFSKDILANQSLL